MTLMKSKHLPAIYLAITVLFVIEIILSWKQYSFAGYYTDKVINWAWLAMTVFMIIRFWKRKTAKAYFTLLLSVIILSILPMMIPFFGIVCYFSTIDDYQQIELNDSYRIERTRPGALSKPQIYIYQKEGILEKKIYKTPYLEIVEHVIQNPLKREPGQKDPQIQQAKLISSNKDSIGIEYQIMGKKHIFYHKSQEDDEFYN